MSADNWAICPKCMAKYVKDRARDASKIEASYGKVPADKYTASLKAFETAKPPDAQTLREDYSIGVDEDGSFSVSYQGRCSVCRLVFEYKYEEQVML